jgi:hypothetical protein
MALPGLRFPTLILVLATSLAAGAGCERKATGPSAGAAIPHDQRPKNVLIERVPHVHQKPDFCGEAAAASYIQSLGVAVDQDDVFDASGMDPGRGMGVTTRELKTALERIGFDVGPVWKSVDVESANAELDTEFAELHADLSRGVPSIVCTRYDGSPTTTEHFRLVLGYERDTDSIVYHEPAEKDGAYKKMPRREFLGLWPLKYEKDRWTVIRFRLDGKEPKKPARARGFRPAEFAQHVMELRKKLPGGFSVVIEPPFVVIGDGGEDEVRSRAEGVVRWSVQHLEKDFFSKSPQRILDVWLFQNKHSYETNTVALFGEPPSTPYGFYSREDSALVMNIATGGGTLVHEIVHPYIEANFPGCPAWFNEGLGSLFEQSAEHEGRIIGLTNWRLPGLQRAILAKRVPSIKELTSTSTSEFYGDDSGLHYAMARYLLYYLQQQGVLRRYYKEIVAHHGEDPSGYDAFVRVLGNPDMNAFQKKWERYVLGLVFM